MGMNSVARNEIYGKVASGARSTLAQTNVVENQQHIAEALRETRETVERQAKPAKCPRLTRELVGTDLDVKHQRHVIHTLVHGSKPQTHTRVSANGSPTSSIDKPVRDGL